MPGGGGGNADTKTRRWTLDDFVVRAGKNTDIVLGTILLTALASPTAAVVAALLGTLYASRDKPVFGMPRDEYLRLKEVLYKSIIAHNDGIRRRLTDYGIKPVDADALLHRVAYDNYLDGLIATYA